MVPGAWCVDGRSAAHPMATGEEPEPAWNYALRASALSIGLEWNWLSGAISMSVLWDNKSQRRLVSEWPQILSK